jgi:hypothetical protein
VLTTVRKEDLTCSSRDAPVSHGSLGRWRARSLHAIRCR